MSPKEYPARRPPLTLSYTAHHKKICVMIGRKRIIVPKAKSPRYVSLSSNAIRKIIQPAETLFCNSSAVTAYSQVEKLPSHTGTASLILNSQRYLPPILNLHHDVDKPTFLPAEYRGSRFVVTVLHAEYASTGS